LAEEIKTEVTIEPSFPFIYVPDADFESFAEMVAKFDIECDSGKNFCRFKGDCSKANKDL